MRFVKVLLSLCILLLGVSDFVLAAHKEPVKSTQGLDISQDVEKLLKLHQNIEKSNVEKSEILIII